MENIEFFFIWILILSILVIGTIQMSWKPCTIKASMRLSCVKMKRFTHQKSERLIIVYISALVKLKKMHFINNPSYLLSVSMISGYHSSLILHDNRIALLIFKTTFSYCSILMSSRVHGKNVHKSRTTTSWFIYYNVKVCNQVYKMAVC